MKVKVNQEACVGCGICQSIAEDVFEINDEGFSEAKTDVVADDKKEQVMDAINSCPTSAIEEINDEVSE